MFYKTTSRLTAIKFLGLFGGATAKQYSDADLREKSEEPATPTTESLVSGARVVGKIPKHEKSFASQAIEFGSRRILGLMLERGVPGLTISVLKEGHIVWNGAFGFCDVENGLECLPEAKMRIASISKSVFAASVIGKMIEKGQLDINSSVHEYLTDEEFPKQKYQDKEVDITIKQLMSHTSGIRHYGDRDSSKQFRPIGSKGSQLVYQCDHQYDRREYFQRKTYRNVVDSLEPFRAGPLASEPGKYSYTSYGFTLLSAVAERALQRSRAQDETTTKSSEMEQIEDHWVKVLRREWGMTKTSLDQDEPILSNRARYYLRSGLEGRLINAPYTDNSVKWAGGGLTSTAQDLVRFGKALIDSYKARDSAKLAKNTVELLWTEVAETYCLGFNTKSLNPDESNGEKRAVYHTGAALGASSVLIIYPESEIVVAILTNLGHLDLSPVGFEIANAFARDM